VSRDLGNNDEGFVLVSVLWIAGLLAAVASTFALAVRLHVMSEANLAGSMEAELAADGLVRLIAYRLAAEPFLETGGEMAVNGEPNLCRFDQDKHAVFTVQDQGGLVDLNRAPLNVLATLIEKASRQGSDPLTLAEALADFRDSDDIRFGVTSGGPEESLIAGGPGMKNAPFQSVDEIEEVIPAAMADLARLKPLLTVYSRQDGIDPDVAPKALTSLLALDRENDRAAVPLAPSRHTVFAIDAEMTGRDGSKFRRIAMMSILRDPQRPFAILEWRQGSGPVADDATALSGTLCDEWSPRREGKGT
jgi:general secretion pathway protein K